MLGLQGSFQRVAGNPRVGTARLSAHGYVAGFRFRFFPYNHRRDPSSETTRTIEDSSGETSGPFSAHGDKSESVYWLFRAVPCGSANAARRGHENLCSMGSFCVSGMGGLDTGGRGGRENRRLRSVEKALGN